MQRKLVSASNGRDSSTDGTGKSDFSVNQRYLIIDFETRSELDLKKVGAYEYSLKAEILCVAWRIGNRKDLLTAPVYSWSPFLEGNTVDSLSPHYHLRNPNVICIAHNAYFEQVICKNVLGIEVPPERWICTASMVAALALPRNLEEACIALKLPVQKDMVGRKVMLKVSKPRKATKNNSDKWHRKMSDLRRIIDYCRKDIEAETHLFLALPPLNPFERKVWLLDQKMNLRGIRVDRPLVKKILGLIAEETKALEEETWRITGGKLTSTRKVAHLRAFVADCGIELPNMQKKTIEDVLKVPDLDPTGKRLLQIRQAISKTSTAKYVAFELRSRSDGFVRDLLKYWGASTGRWAGQGLQIQNFPKGEIKDLDTWKAIEVIRHSNLETLRAIYGSPMSLFSSCLRSMIMAREGTSFFRGDYASIELRVLFWVAGHQKGLDAIIRGADLYSELAADIYRKPLSAVGRGTSERDVGKQATLGSGFGLGHVKFITTCEKEGITISKEVAKSAIDAYRSKHAPVPQMWKDIEHTAISAVQNPGKIFKTNKTEWLVKDNFLWCKLPSGRKLAYAYPSVRMEKNKWGKIQTKLYHWGVDPHTHKWCEQGTWGGILVENCVQAIARDILAIAMLRLEDHGFSMALTIHDENVAEGSNKLLATFKSLMIQKIEWASGLPIDTEIWQGPRYKK